MKSIEELALQCAEEVGIKFDPAFGSCYTGNRQLERFAKAVIAAWVAQQEPVAWRIDGQLVSHNRCIGMEPLEPLYTLDLSASLRSGGEGLGNEAAPTTDYSNRD